MNPVPTKRCRSCEKVKRLERFVASKNLKDGHRNICKPCANAYAKRMWAQKPGEKAAYMRRWRRKHPGEWKRGYLRTCYGIEVEAYSAMVRAQRGLCAICRKPNLGGRALYVDHDHATRKIRSLLCLNCNFLLGFAESRSGIATLRAAITYLEAHSRVGSRRRLAHVERRTDVIASA